jgi:hypothetical protein
MLHSDFMNWPHYHFHSLCKFYSIVNIIAQFVLVNDCHSCAAIDFPPVLCRLHNFEQKYLSSALFDILS